MRLSDIDEGTLEILDQSCDGTISALQGYCFSQRCEAHVSIQTHLEGLERGEMKMFLQIVREGDTVDYAIARMNAPAQTIGWNLYLADLLDSVRGRIDCANKAMAQGSKMEREGEGT